MDRSLFEKSLVKFREGTSSMVEAIEVFVKEKGDVKFFGEVDCASCEPLYGVGLVDDEVMALGVNDNVSLDDLTSNELYAIVCKLMCELYNEL